MRGAPPSGFSRLMCRIGARTSCDRSLHRAMQDAQLVTKREDLKLQGSPIAERCAQSQEQRDDDRSH